MNRGYSVISLYCAKDAQNVGGVLRAAQCYDSSMVVLERPRTKQIRSGANTTKTQRHIPVITAQNMWDHIPFDCIPVAIEFNKDAEPLHTFEHPERAFYIFGPEDGTLGKATTERCKHTVYVPTRFCMNLAATVNVVLYDRTAKQIMREAA